jgi:2-polyprenyl-3-methyl-5-hydroxy-6-metoxy-1,4-benzoquinol methylase
MQSHTSLSIGVTRLNRGWKLLLDQEKVSYHVINLSKEISANDVPLIIITKAPQGLERKTLINYLENGGTVLSYSLHLKNILNLDLAPIKIDSLSGKTRLFNHTSKIYLGLGGYFTKGISPRRVKNQIVAKVYGKINQNHNAINSFSFGKGHIILLPFDVNLALINQKTTCRSFYSSNGPLQENVSLVSKDNVRQLVQNCFVYLLSKNNLPYVHVWYYPNKFETAFNFRLDVDGRKIRDMGVIINVSSKLKIPLTWFFCMKNYGSVNNKIKTKNKIINQKLFYSLKSLGHDVQSHGFQHMIYNNYSDNYLNISKASELLRDYGFKTIGFSSPHGHWNNCLGKALVDNNFVYSSDFSLDYSAFPSFLNIKDINGRQNKFMQIPIHPICIGRMLEQNYTLQSMNNYFDAAINQNYVLNKPLFFYGHPENRVGKYFSVLEFILKKVKKYNNVWIATLSQFNGWWKLRDQLNYGLTLKSNELSINMSKLSSLQVKQKNSFKPHLHVIVQGREFLMPLKSGTFFLNKFKSKPITSFFPIELISQKPFIKQSQKLRSFFNKVNLKLRSSIVPSIKRIWKTTFFDLFSSKFTSLEVRSAQLPLILKYLKSLNKKIGKLDILDAGCYDGLLTLHFYNKNNLNSVLGIDIDASVIYNAKKSAKRLKKNITFKKANVENFDVGKNKFDVVVSSSVLQYVNSPLNTLIHFNKVLKENGKLILTVPTTNHFLFMHKWAFLSRIPFISLLFSNNFPNHVKNKADLVKYYKDLHSSDKFHRTIGGFDKESLSKILRKSGFKSIKFIHSPNKLAQFFRELRLSTPLARLMLPIILPLSWYFDKYFPAAKTELIIIAEKSVKK